MGVDMMARRMGNKTFLPQTNSSRTLFNTDSTILLKAMGIIRRPIGDANTASCSLMNFRKIRSQNASGFSGVRIVRAWKTRETIRVLRLHLAQLAFLYSLHFLRCSFTKNLRSFLVILPVVCFWIPSVRIKFFTVMSWFYHMLAYSLLIQRRMQRSGFSWIEIIIFALSVISAKTRLTGQVS